MGDRPNELRANLDAARQHWRQVNNLYWNNQATTADLDAAAQEEIDAQNALRAQGGGNVLYNSAMTQGVAETAAVAATRFQTFSPGFDGAFIQADNAARAAFAGAYGGLQMDQLGQTMDGFGLSASSPYYDNSGQSFTSASNYGTDAALSAPAQGGLGPQVPFGLSGAGYDGGNNTGYGNAGSHVSSASYSASNANWGLAASYTPYADDASYGLSANNPLATQGGYNPFTPEEMARTQEIRNAAGEALAKSQETQRANQERLRREQEKREAEDRARRERERQQQAERENQERSRREQVERKSRVQTNESNTQPRLLRGDQCKVGVRILFYQEGISQKPVGGTITALREKLELAMKYTAKLDNGQTLYDLAMFEPVYHEGRQFTTLE